MSDLGDLMDDIVEATGCRGPETWIDRCPPEVQEFLNGTLAPAYWQAKQEGRKTSVEGCLDVAKRKVKELFGADHICVQRQEFDRWLKRQRPPEND